MKRLLTLCVALGLASAAIAQDRKSPAEAKAAAFKSSVEAGRQKTGKPESPPSKDAPPPRQRAAAVEQAKAEILKAIAELRADVAAKVPQIKDDAQAGVAELKERLAQALRENDELRARLRKAEAVVAETRAQLEAAVAEARRQAERARAEAERALVELKRARMLEAEQRKKAESPSETAVPKKALPESDAGIEKRKADPPRE